MIGISTRPCHDLDRLHKRERLIVCKDPDQLRYKERRMCVVDLYDRVIEHTAQIALAGFHLSHDQLRSAAHHEVMLIKPELSARLVGIIGIDEHGQILFDRFLVKRDPVLHKRIIKPVNIKEFELVDAALIACDIQVIHSGCDFPSPKQHIKGHFRAVFPGLPLQPFVLLHYLQMILKPLLKDAIVIIEANPFRGIAQRRDRIKKAG